MLSHAAVSMPTYFGQLEDVVSYCQFLEGRADDACLPTWASFCDMRMVSDTTGVTAAISDASGHLHLLKLLSEMRSSASFLPGWTTPCNFDKVTSKPEWDLKGYLASHPELGLFPFCSFLSLQRPYSVVKSSGKQHPFRAGTVWLKNIAVMQDIVPPAEWMQNPRAEEALLEFVSSLSERGFS